MLDYDAGSSGGAPAQRWELREDMALVSESRTGPGSQTWGLWRSGDSGVVAKDVGSGVDDAPALAKWSLSHGERYRVSLVARENGWALHGRGEGERVRLLRFVNGRSAQVFFFDGNLIRYNGNPQLVLTVDVLIGQVTLEKFEGGPNQK